MPAIKRIQYDKYGGPELMHLEDFMPPKPGKGQVLVRVLAAAANPMDWKVRNGDTKMMTGRRFPRGMGHDFSGIIEEVGEGVTRWHPGDAVLGGMSLKASGAFAEMVLADQDNITAKPEQLSYEQAATLPTVGVTAVQSLIESGELRAGQSVFINGCLGGVGRTAAQIAIMRGASVGGSCRDRSSSAARELGIAPVVGFDFEPRTLNGQFDLVFDTAGTMPLKSARTMLKSGGRFLDINMTPGKMMRSLIARDYKGVIAKYTPESLETVAQAAAQGQLDLPVARAVPLTDAIGALTELERHRTPRGGKLVITTQ